MGYFMGPRFDRFTRLDEPSAVQQVLRRMAYRFGDVVYDSYMRHTMWNWTAVPNVRGTYSSCSNVWNDAAEGLEIVDQKLVFAGEAFPVDGDQQGWVYTAMHSGLAAADQVGEWR